MVKVTSRMTVTEYRKKARGYVSRIMPNRTSSNLDDRAYALYLQRFFFGTTGIISYTYSGNTWKMRELRRELPLSKKAYLAIKEG